MKFPKFIVILFILSLLVSCGGNDWADTVISNESGYEVTFKFNHTGEYTLDADGVTTVTFPTRVYQYLEKHDPVKRVTFEFSSTNDGYTGKFVTLPSWTVEIKNDFIDTKVTLSAGGWMDDITLDPDSVETGTIYTKNPGFSAVAEDGFPALITWFFDDESDEFKVLIH
ncbi:MAG: hypothetical protein FWG89_09510 [Treponema sp.]|nr:hypothetical protein [Treponema sp.]